MISISELASDLESEMNEYLEEEGFSGFALEEVSEEGFQEEYLKAQKCPLPQTEHKSGDLLVTATQRPDGEALGLRFSKGGEDAKYYLVRLEPRGQNAS